MKNDNSVFSKYLGELRAHSNGSETITDALKKHGESYAKRLVSLQGEDMLYANNRDFFEYLLELQLDGVCPVTVALFKKTESSVDNAKYLILLDTGGASIDCSAFENFVQNSGSLFFKFGYYLESNELIEEIPYPLESGQNGVAATQKITTYTLMTL